MFKQKVDVFIPTVPKDIVQLEFAIESLEKYIPNIGCIHISSPEKMITEQTKYNNLVCHYDMEILPNTPLNLCHYRKNWIFQQLLKLFQNVTSTDYVLIFDSDNILMRQLNLFTDDGKPIQYIGEYQNHEPYFNFIQLISGKQLGREYDGSFICDLGLFNRSFIMEMLTRFSFSQDSFIEFTLRNSSQYCHISEFELYGNYMEKYHPDIYEKRQLSSIQHMRFQFNPYQSIWSRDQIIDIINSTNNDKYDILHIRSGCTNDNLRWQI